MRTKLTFLFLFISFSSVIGQPDCVLPEAQAIMHGNNVRATILNGGDLFTTGAEAGFEAPYNSSTNVHSIFSAALWMGGFDPAGNLKLAGQTYRASNGTDYFSGPVNSMTGLTEVNACTNYDKIWSVRYHEIIAHLADLEDDGVVQNPISSIYSWPGRDNPHSIDFNGFELPAGAGMAPFFDANQDGLYDPADGDYPHPNQVEEGTLPAQITWSVFNDIGEAHTFSNAAALQVEVQLTTFSFFCASNPALNNTVFTSHKIINRAFERLDSVQCGFWVDFDLGCYTDDYLGCYPPQNAVYTYNSDPVDGDFAGCSGNVESYPAGPPVQSVCYLNHDLDHFNVFNNDAFNPNPGLGEPATPLEFYNYLSGSFRDGTPITEGGSGYNPTSNDIVPWVYPGDPNNSDEWSMLQHGALQGDRRAISSIAIDQLQPGGIVELDAAWTLHGNDNNDNLENVTLMQSELTEINALYDNRFMQVCGDPYPNCADSDCVWPGDSNNDGVANHEDIIPIGIKMGLPGVVRAGPKTWAPEIGTDWNNTTLLGLEVKFADCDGNGTIEEADIGIIDDNLGSTHSGYHSSYTPSPGSELTLKPVFSDPEISVPLGGLSELLGIGLDVPDELYALSLSVEMESPFFRSVSILNLAGWSTDDFISYKYSSEHDDKTYVNLAWSKTEELADNRDGTIVRFLVTTAIPNQDYIPAERTTMRFVNVKGYRKDGTLIDMGGGTLDFIFDVSTSVPSVEKSGIEIFPNPTSSILNIQFEQPEEAVVSLIDIAGVQVLRKEITMREVVQLDLNQLPKGVYTIQVNSATNTFVKKVVLQ